MSRSVEELREHVRGAVTRRIDSDEDRRKEAVYEFLAVTMSADHATMERAAELVPPVMTDLYAKWVEMFLDRFFETVPQEQIELLCDGTPENDAALALVYIMFLESERMEEQIDKDLREYGLEMTGAEDMGDLAADYIRAKMAQLGKEIKGKDGK